MILKMILPADESKPGTFSTLSISIGGMMGAGIFAVTGQTVQLTKGCAPVAFLIAGIVAAFAIEIAYRRVTGRGLRLARRHPEA